MSKLYQAAAGGSVSDVLRVVETHPKSVWERAENGFTPLHAAAVTNLGRDSELMVGIIVTAAAVNTRKKRCRLVNARAGASKSTPAHLAARRGQHHALQALAFAGADFGLRTTDGRTPLDDALANGYVKCAKIIRRNAVPRTCKIVHVQQAIAGGLTTLEAQRYEILDLLKAAKTERARDCYITDYQRLESLLDDCAAAAGIPPASFSTRHNVDQYRRSGVAIPAHALNLILVVI